MFFVFRLFRGLFRSGSTKRYSQTFSHTQLQPAYKNKAQSENYLRTQIQYLPKASVKRVLDGDTVIANKDWHEITIRLDSIDCPEDGQPWGDIAKYGLIKMIGGGDVRIEEHGIDPHSRTLATLYVWDNKRNDWTNVNERMVMLGHAWVMRLYYDHLPKDRQEKINRLERWARAKKIGLWSMPHPVPPWKWRKGGYRNYS